MAEVLVLDRATVRGLLPLEAVIPVIERAFVAFSAGRTVAYPWSGKRSQPTAASSESSPGI